MKPGQICRATPPRISDAKGAGRGLRLPSPQAERGHVGRRRCSVFLGPGRRLSSASSARHRAPDLARCWSAVPDDSRRCRPGSPQPSFSPRSRVAAAVLLRGLRGEKQQPRAQEGGWCRKGTRRGRLPRRGRAAPRPLRRARPESPPSGGAEPRRPPRFSALGHVPREGDREAAGPAPERARGGGAGRGGGGLRLGRLPGAGSDAPRGPRPLLPPLPPARKAVPRPAVAVTTAP